MNITINYLSEQFERTRKFAGKEEALKRARSCIAGLTLGRDFSESFEDYLKRNDTARHMYELAQLYIKEVQQPEISRKL